VRLVQCARLGGEAGTVAALGEVSLHHDPFRHFAMSTSTITRGV
jgi:hypothetical protein